MYVPQPDNLTLCGLPGASSVTVTVPLREPLLLGLNVTLMVQLAPAATLVPQVFVWLNWPVAVMPVIVNVPVPVLLSVTVWALLVVNTTWVAKVRLLGERL